MNKLAIAALALLGAIGTAHAAGDAKAGQTKAAACAACHGMDGNSPANPLWPKLAGQHPDYIVKQLTNFKDGLTADDGKHVVRKDPTMGAMAAPLSAQDMADLAAFFNGQARAIGSAKAELAAKGEKIFRGGIADKGVAACMACHGPNGAGNPTAAFPAVGGQHATYNQKALKDFRAGTRANDPAKMMRDVAAKLSDAEIEAVAEYMSGLH